MTVTLSDSLREFVQKQVSSGRYPSADDYIQDLLRTEAAMLDRVNSGEALPVDEHFDRRLGVLLDEAEQSGDYLDVTAEDFDRMEREAKDLTRERRSS